ncbi:MAG: Xaa-Pro peptidase family protein [Candidatus Paceibacterota bacterium]
MATFIFDTTQNADLYYAIRRSMDDPVFFLEQDSGKQFVFLNKIEYGAFTEQNSVPSLTAIELEPFIDRAKGIEGDDPLRLKVALIILKEYGLEEQAITVPASFPVQMADYLRKNSIALKPDSSLFPGRACKKDGEINALRKSLTNTADAFAFVEGMLQEASIRNSELMLAGEVLTSERVKREVAKFLFDRDMVSDSGIIVASGAQTAMPHHGGAGALLANEPIIVDIFPRDQHTGYYGDMTRTYIRGEPSERVRVMYQAVHEAHQVAFGMLASGVPAREVHKAAAAVFERHGFITDEDSGFIHATGHGLGVAVHEAPAVSASSEDTLEAGNVITIEPGLYYSESGGVRIEDVALITDDGYVTLCDDQVDEWVI